MSLHPKPVTAIPLNPKPLNHGTEQLSEADALQDPSDALSK